MSTELAVCAVRDIISSLIQEATVFREVPHQLSSDLREKADATEVTSCGHFPIAADIVLQNHDALSRVARPL